MVLWLAAIAVPALSVACRVQRFSPPTSPGNEPAENVGDGPAAAMAQDVMSRNGLSVDGAHLRLTPLRAPNAADSARANELLESVKAGLERYRDVSVAEADGFRRFLPGVPQPIYHYTSWRNAVAERWRFDPAQPTSLLYRPHPDGSLELVGAMYAASPRTSLDELNRRIPLSIARWHQHVNWCLPPRGEMDRWREVKEGVPVFGPRSPVADAGSCAQVGGRFYPRIFGWMLHIEPFGDSDQIWGHHGTTLAHQH